MTSSSFLFSEWISPPPGQTHCLKEPDQVLRGLTHSLQPHTLSDSSSPRFTILPAPQCTHTLTAVLTPHSLTPPWVQAWAPSLDALLLPDSLHPTVTGGDSAGIVPAHHEPQTLNLPQEACVVLWETEAPEKSKRRRGSSLGRKKTDLEGLLLEIPCSRVLPTSP